MKFLKNSVPGILIILGMLSSTPSIATTMPEIDSIEQCRQIVRELQGDCFDDSIFIKACSYVSGVCPIGVVGGIKTHKPNPLPTVYNSSVGLFYRNMYKQCISSNNSVKDCMDKTTKAIKSALK